MEQSSRLYHPGFTLIRDSYLHFSNVRKTPALAAPTSIPAPIATPTAKETNMTPIVPVGPASAAPGSEPDDATKKTSTLPDPQPTQRQKQKKKDKSIKAQPSSLRPTEKKQTHAKTQLATKRQSKKESNAPIWREETTEGNQTSDPAERGRRVHFAMGVKKEDAGSRRSPSKLSSSNGSWIDPPSKGRPADASDRKTGIKGKRDTDVSRSVLKPDLTKSSQAVLDFDDVWSDDSDGEGSAIDISDSHGPALPNMQPALRGVLKTRGQNYSTSQAQTYTSTHFQSNNVTQGQAKPIVPRSLTFTRKDLERAKRSGYHPEAVQAIGHNSQPGPSSESRRRQKRDALPQSLPQSWSVASEFGSTVDQGDRRSAVQAQAEDDRINKALKQARSNGKRNRRTTTPLSSGQGQFSSRSPLEATQRQSPASHLSNGERQGAMRSSRSAPVFVFRPSDSSENDPGIVVHTQAELDEARRNYYERRDPASSSSQYTKKGRKSRKAAFAESDSESDSV